MSLSNAEEQLMQILWKLEKAFMKDLIDAYPASGSSVVAMDLVFQDRGKIDALCPVGISLIACHQIRVGDIFNR